jgi:hypothetical protein
VIQFISIWKSNNNYPCAYISPKWFHNSLKSPSNWVGFPFVLRTPSLEILNNGLGVFLGFTTGLYPVLNTTSNYSVDYPITPIGSDVTSYIN